MPRVRTFLRRFRLFHRVAAALIVAMTSTVVVVQARTTEALAYHSWWPWHKVYWQRIAPFRVQGTEHANGGMADLTPVRVLIVGGSIAAGWKDAPHQSYLIRAMQSLASYQQSTYEIYQRAIPGARAVGAPARYLQWLKSIHPQVVILSWGLLNDCHAGTPVSQVRDAVDAQIKAALAEHAVVCLVTPPVSAASYTVYKDKQSAYVAAELQAAHYASNPNVHVYDLYDAMKDYLASHHQSYQTYRADNWHPNRAGHILAGQLLANEWIQKYGRHPIQFVGPIVRAPVYHPIPVHPTV